MIGLVLANVAISIIELVSVYSMTKQLAQKNERIRVALVIASAYLIASVLNTQFLDNMLIRLLINVLLLYAFTYTFKINKYVRVLSIFIFLGVSLLMEYGIGLFASIITGTPIFEFQNNIFIYALTAITGKFAIYVLIKILFKFILKKGTAIEKRYNFLNLIMPLVSIVVVFVMTLTIFYTSNLIVGVFTIITALLLIVANIGSFIIYENSVENSIKAEKLRYEKIISEDKQKELNLLIDTQIKANKEIHEVKNRMYTLRDMVDSADSSAKELIDELCDIYKGKELVEYTSISGVDILLNAKKHIANEKKVNLKYNINIHGELHIDSIDLCMALGNMLDNAIENATTSKIVLSMKTHENYLSIKCENGTEQSVIDELKTTKNNEGLMHGYGLIRINEIANKYDGNFETIIKDNKFIAGLLLNSGWKKTNNNL